MARIKYNILAIHPPTYDPPYIGAEAYKYKRKLKKKQRDCIPNWYGKDLEPCVPPIAEKKRKQSSGSNGAVRI